MIKVVSGNNADRNVSIVKDMTVRDFLVDNMVPGVGVLTINGVRIGDEEFGTNLSEFGSTVYVLRVHKADNA